MQPGLSQHEHLSNHQKIAQEFQRNGITKAALSCFQGIIYRYYGNNQRAFPWRKTSDPYRILISEIMLQQTQTRRVVEKYEGFIEAFPDFSALAQADLISILTLWQGLGYNRRALALRKIAETVVREFHGELPDTYEGLISLPGIGRATAGSILAFAFNKPVSFIETNIRRVFIHFFFDDQEGINDNEILPLVEKTLDRKKPRQWYYALMDYGSMLKDQTPNPNRKSAHYLRQAPFHGSDRQARGLIIKTLVANSAMDQGDLIEKLGMDAARVRKNLSSLEKEGFITRCQSVVRIK